MTSTPFSRLLPGFRPKLASQMRRKLPNLGVYPSPQSIHEQYQWFVRRPIATRRAWGLVPPIVVPRNVVVTKVTFRQGSGVPKRFPPMTISSLGCTMSEVREPKELPLASFELGKGTALR